VKTVWSVFHSYHRLLLLLVLLACLAPQITIFAPILRETTSSATGESISDLVGDLQVGDSSSHAQSIINQAVTEASITRTESMVELISVPPPSEQPLDASVAWVPSGGQELLKADPPTLESVLPAVQPLRFTFPEAPSPLTSGWRPPLYPVPWAKAPQDHFYFVRPIAADDINWPLWDYRYGGMFFENVVHTGIDIPARVGTPVVAAGSGKVIWAGSGLYNGENDPDDPYGLAIAIQHDFSYRGESLYTIYGHMDRIDVVWGQLVKTGEPLGLSGATGRVTGPHLHFEVRVGRNGFLSTRNPELWLAPPQGWGLLAGRVMDTGGQLIDGQEVHVLSSSSSLKRSAKSYGLDSVNSDPYYQENIIISDLPAGVYEIRIDYAGFSHKQQVEIKPGLVSYFTFQGHRKFGPMEPPPTQVEFLPFHP
jgi:murein DD-endopeptidase MepM/ murein hydrolase activator NlpD